MPWDVLGRFRLKVFKRLLDVTFRDMVNDGLGNVWFTVRLDVRSFFQPKQIHDSPFWPWIQCLFRDKNLESDGVRNRKPRTANMETQFSPAYLSRNKAPKRQVLFNFLIRTESSSDLAFYSSTGITRNIRWIHSFFISFFLFYLFFVLIEISYLNVWQDSCTYTE